MEIYKKCVNVYNSCVCVCVCLFFQQNVIPIIPIPIRVWVWARVISVPSSPPQKNVVPAGFAHAGEQQRRRR